MGRRFAAASTDKITTTLTTAAAQRTYAMWTNRDAGATGNCPIFRKATTGTVDVGTVRIVADTILQQYHFFRTHSGVTGKWAVAWPSASVWHHVAIVYDDSSTSNDALIYFDGVSQSVTRATAPSGTPVDDSAPFQFGNRGAGDQPWIGDLCEFAIWDRLLTPSELSALGLGVSPLAFPNALALYLPIVREVNDYFNDAPTLTGTTVVDHPRVIYPRAIRELGRAPQVIERTVPESVGAAADAMTRLTTRPRAATESAGTASDALSRTLSLARETAQAASTVTDTPTRTLSLARTTPESVIEATDAATRLITRARTVSESPAVASDDVTRLTTRPRTVTESPGVASDALTRLTTQIRTVSESPGVPSDAATRLITRGRTVSESPGVASDDVTRLTTQARTLSESLTVPSDALARILALLRNTQETIPSPTDEVHAITLLVVRGPVGGIVTEPLQPGALVGEPPPPAALVADANLEQ